MKVDVHPDLKKKTSFYVWEKANFPGDEVFWEVLCREATRMTAPVEMPFFERCGTVWWHFSWTCLSPGPAHELHLDRDQDPPLRLHLQQHPTDPSWPFVHVPDLQDHEETKAFLSTMPQAPTWLGPNKSSPYWIRRRAIIPRRLTPKPCSILSPQNLCQAGAGNQWQTSPSGHHFHMVSPAWAVSA